MRKLFFFKTIYIFWIFLLGFTASASSADACHIELDGIKITDSFLEGEVFNKGTRETEEVWIHIDFQTSNGTKAFEQDFRVIPGGDGHTIPPNWSKHFRYELKLNGAGKLTPLAHIKSVKFK